MKTYCFSVDRVVTLKQQGTFEVAAEDQDTAFERAREILDSGSDQPNWDTLHSHVDEDEPELVDVLDEKD